MKITISFFINAMVCGEIHEKKHYSSDALNFIYNYINETMPDEVFGLNNIYETFYEYDTIDQFNEEEGYDYENIRDVELDFGKIIFLKKGSFLIIRGEQKDDR